MKKVLLFSYAEVPFIFAQRSKQSNINREQHKKKPAYYVTKVELLNDDTSSSSSGGRGIDESITSVALANILKDVEKSYDKGK